MRLMTLDMRLLTLFPVPLHFFLQDYFFLAGKKNMDSND